MQHVKLGVVLVLVGLIVSLAVLADRRPDGNAKLQPTKISGPVMDANPSKGAATGCPYLAGGNAGKSEAPMSMGGDCCGGGGRQSSMGHDHGSEAADALAERKVANDECPICSMDTAKSPTIARYFDKKKKETDFVSLECWIEYAAAHKLPYENAAIVDYPTVGGDEELVPVKDAFYVPLESLKHSMPPYLAAFSDKDKAKEFADSKDSEVLDFKGAQAVVAKFQEEQEKEEHGHHMQM